MLKKSLRWLSLFILFVVMITPLYNLIQGKDIMGGNTETKCGTIIDKLQPNDLSIGKYNAKVSVNSTLVIQYPDMIEEETVAVDTYYNNNVGDTVCFTSRNIGPVYITVISMIGLTLLILGAIYLFSLFIQYILS